MNKLLNALLVLSVFAAVVPAQAVQTRQQKRKKDMSTLTVVSEDRDLILVDEEVQNEASVLNRKAVIAAAVAAGAMATAAYLYATGSAPVVLDCNVIANAYCAGAQVAPAALQACKANLPKIACWLF